MPGRPAVAGAQLCIQIPEQRPCARLLKRAPYLPEPSMANLFTGLQLLPIAGLMLAKGLEISCQTVTNWVHVCQRHMNPIFGYQGPVIHWTCGWITVVVPRNLEVCAKIRTQPRFAQS
jgi:hypothetical protein